VPHFLTGNLFAVAFGRGPGTTAVRFPIQSNPVESRRLTVLP